jgi:hypothetical protein
MKRRTFIPAVVGAVASGAIATGAEPTVDNKEQPSDEAIAIARSLEKVIYRIYQSGGKIVRTNGYTMLHRSPDRRRRVSALNLDVTFWIEWPERKDEH